MVRLSLLEPYNVSGTISDPILTVVDGLGQVVATNDNWGDFPSASSIQSDGRAPTSSAESVVQVSVTQGNYTAIVSGASGATGVSLVEVYDEETGGASIELSNLSTRAYVGTGDSQMIAGFIVGGETGSTSTVTIRALGPTIASAPYNVVGTITDPILTIVDGTGQVVATVDNWESSTSASAITSTTEIPAIQLRVLISFLSPGQLHSYSRWCWWCYGCFVSRSLQRVISQLDTTRYRLLLAIHTIYNHLSLQAVFYAYLPWRSVVLKLFLNYQK